MPDYSKRINELNEVLAETERGIERLRRELGTKVIRLKKADRPDGIDDQLAEHKALTSTIDNAGTAIERMAAIDARQAEIRDEMKRLQEEHDQLEKGLDPIYEQIGAVAFRLFREHPLVDASYSGAFEGLARYYDQVRSIDTELEQIGAGTDGSNRNLMEKVGLKSREFLLRNRRSVKENQLPRLLTKAGRELVDGDFIDAMDDEELNRAAQPYRDLRTRQGEVRETLEELRAESGRLVDEFNAVSGGRKLAPARRARETEIETARTRLNEVLTAVGKAAAEGDIEQLSEEREAIRQEEARAAHFRTLLARLEAGREMVRVQKELDALVARQEKAAGQIRELESQIESLKTDQAARKAELAQYRAERGDESELFEP